MKKSITLFLGNFLIFLGIILSINILLISFWEVRLLVYKFQKPKEEKVDARASLPNYKDISWVKTYFSDFNRLTDNNYYSYVGWRKPAFSSPYINIDSFGFRITPQHSTLKDNSAIIVFLGGSTMWATGSPDSSTIPAFAAQCTSGKFKVLNYGESGYRALQSFNLLFMSMSNGFKPKVVVSYDGVNEAVGLLKHNHYFSQYPEAEIRGKLNEKKEFNRLVTDLTFKHYLIDPILTSVSRLKAQKVVEPLMEIDTQQLAIDRVAHSLLNTWLLMSDLCKRNGAVFIPVLQPNAGVGSPKTDYLTFPHYEHLLLKSYKPLYRRIVYLIENDLTYEPLKRNFLNLSNVLNQKDFFYIDWCHLSPNGNKIVADKICNHLTNLNR